MIHQHKTIVYKGKVVFHKMTITSPGRELKPFQDNEACFMFVNNGEFSIRTPDVLLPFKQGEGLLAKCFNFFVETTKGQRAQNETMEYLGVFMFSSQVEALLNLDLSSSNKRVDFNAKKIPLDKLFKSYRDSIDVLLEHPDIADEAIIETKLKEFILLIAKSQGLSPLDFLSAMFRLNHTEFRVTIQNNLYSNLSVSELAKLCSMSISSFKRRFHEEYGESPKNYFAKMKLQNAANMLSNSTERISSIAYDSGYETISTFNRQFKRVYGVSPTEFRLSQTA